MDEAQPRQLNLADVEFRPHVPTEGLYGWITHTELASWILQRRPGGVPIGFSGPSMSHSQALRRLTCGDRRQRHDQMGIAQSD
jgi:hypothetical protein